LFTACSFIAPAAIASLWPVTVVVALFSPEKIEGVKVPSNLALFKTAAISEAGVPSVKGDKLVMTASFRKMKLITVFKN
jgi:hypothetical protein